MKFSVLFLLICIGASAAFLPQKKLFGNLPAFQNDDKNKLTNIGTRLNAKFSKFVSSSVNFLPKKLQKVTATNSFIFVNVFLFLLQQVYPSIQSRLLKSDRMIYFGETYRLLSSCFVHGSLLHLGFNMYSLYNTGPTAERLFGVERYATFFILSGVLGNVMTYALHSSPFSLGASGCICGLLGAITAFYYRNRLYLGSEADNGK